MKGFTNYQLDIDQSRVKRRATEYRLAQRAMKSLEQLATRKVDLLDLDKGLVKLNQHVFKQSDFVQEKQLKMEIDQKIKAPEELDKFMNYKHKKEQDQYQKNMNILDQGILFAQKEMYQGKKFKEEKKQESIKKNDFGLLKGILKPKSDSKQDFDENSTTIVSLKMIPDQKTESKVQFEGVFRADSSLNNETLKEVYPEINLEPTHQKINKSKQKFQSQILVQKDRKVKFNEVAKEIPIDPYFDPDQSVFRDTEKIGDALSQAQTVKLEQPLDEDYTDWNQLWSQNIIQYQDLTQYKRKAPEQYQLKQIDKAQEMRYNNIYLHSILPKNRAYYQGGDQGSAIEKSLKSLQNLKFHQHDPQPNIDYHPSFHPIPNSQISQIQNQQLELNRFQEQDIEQEDILRQYQQEENQIKVLAEMKGTEIEQPINLMQSYFNSNQTQKSIFKPNFGGVKDLQYEFMKDQFKLKPQQNQVIKEQFTSFYPNIQEPLDILHKATDVHSIAREAEKQYLNEQLLLKNQLLTYPRPNFLQNQPLLYKQGNEKKIYEQRGNIHQKMQPPDYETLQRMCNPMITVLEARNKFQYKF